MTGGEDDAPLGIGDAGELIAAEVYAALQVERSLVTGEDPLDQGILLTVVGRAFDQARQEATDWGLGTFDGTMVGGRGAGVRRWAMA